MNSSPSQLDPLEVCTGLVLEDPLLQPENDDEDEQGDEDAPTLSSGCGFGCMLLILPFLMLLQFNMSLQVSNTSGLSEQMVLGVIGIFVVASFTHKMFLLNENTPWLLPPNSLYCHHFLMLLPEIIIDIILGLVLVFPVEIGFEALLLATLALSSVVFVKTIRILLCPCKEKDYGDGMDSSEKSV